MSGKIIRDPATRPDAHGGPVLKKSTRLTALLLCLALLLSACGKGDEPETLRKSGFRTVPIRVSAKYANAGDVKLKNYAAELLGGFEGGAFLDLCRLMKKSEALEAALGAYEDGFSDALRANREKYGEDYQLKILLIAGREERFGTVQKTEWKDWLQELGGKYAEAGRQLAKMDKKAQMEYAASIGLELTDLRELAGQLSAMGSLLKAAEVEDGWVLGVDRRISGSALDRPSHSKSEMTVMKVNGVWISPEVRQLLLMPLSALELLSTAELS